MVPRPLVVSVSLPLERREDGRVALKPSVVLGGERCIAAALENKDAQLVKDAQPNKLLLLVADELQAFNIDEALLGRIEDTLEGYTG